MNKIKIIFDKLIHHFYYYVPPCPSCKSHMTGYYIKLHRDTDTQWQINESLRHGELVKAVQVVPSKNCFCVACGYEWYDSVDLRFVSREFVKKQKKERLTIEILNKRIEEQKQEIKNDHAPFKGIRRFIGKL